MAKAKSATTTPASTPRSSTKRPAAAAAAQAAPLEIDVQALKTQLAAAPTQDDVLEIFAFAVAGSIDKGGQVKAFSILDFVPVIIEVVRTIITKCGESDIRSELENLKGNPNNLRGRLARMKLKRQLRGQLRNNDQAQYELSKGLIAQGIAALRDNDVWDGAFGRFGGWVPPQHSPAPTEAPKPTPAPAAKPASPAAQ